MRAIGWLRWILIVWNAIFLAAFLMIWVMLPDTPLSRLDTVAGTLAYFVATLTYLVFSKPRPYRAQQHLKRVGDQNELDCLEEMAGTYRRSGYPNREYIEQCIRDIEVNHEPSRLRDSYLEDARSALEERRRLGEGRVVSIKAD